MELALSNDIYEIIFVLKIEYTKNTQSLEKQKI